MPRQPRQLLHQSYYHIMARGNNKNIIFHKEDDYKYYLDLIKKYKKLHPFSLYHYCLMPNHVHLLVRTNKGTDFSNFMKKINLSYFCYYRNHYGWTGHFWQDRFKSQPVGKDNYFLQCGKYIELNPVRSGITEKPSDYKFSSYLHYAEGKKNNLITLDMFYSKLGDTDRERQKKYRELVIGEMIENSYKNKVWGSRKQKYQEARKVKYHST